MIFGKAGSKGAIFLFVLVIFLIIVGAFLFYVWHETQNGNENQGETVWEKEDVGGFTVEGNLIKNNAYGLSIQAPAGWTIKNYQEGGVGIFSPGVDANSFIKSAREKKGCVLGITLTNYKKVNSNIETDAERLLKEIKAVQKNKTILDEEDVKFEVVLFGGKDALERIYFVDGEKASVEVAVAIGETIYSVRNSPIFSQMCIGYFDDMVKTVRINK
jgi:hypothetical protein